MRPAHHELCFGCGRTNLFGLLLELERTGPDAVSGRCFIKQDHQGAERGSAHEGVIAAALSEAMALACGPEYRARHLKIAITGSAAVGTFLEVEAHAPPHTLPERAASASATAGGRQVARATGAYGPS